MKTQVRSHESRDHNRVSRSDAKNAAMRARIGMLLAVIGIGVARPAAQAQYYPEVRNPWRPVPGGVSGFPPNWRPGPGGAPYSPFGPQDPLDPRSPWGPQSHFGPLGIVPSEPRVGDTIDQKQNGNPNPAASAPISPEMLAQLVNPPKIDANFDPVNLPRLKPFPHEPIDTPAWPHWGWLVGGILVLSLLARPRRDYVAPKHSAQ